MERSGNEFSFDDPRFAVVGMASEFFGKEFAHTPNGYHDAMVALEAQHVRVQPPIPDTLRITEVVVEDSPILAVSEQMVAIGIADEDYELAMSASNTLFVFGETDFQDSLGGRAFALSLSAHEQLARSLLERFAFDDPYLRGVGRNIFAEIDRLKTSGDAHKALELMRGVIHTAAFNGTMGQGARSRFDPFAILDEV